MRDVPRRLLACGLLTALGAAPCAAQTIVRVTVTDTLGVAVSDANLRLLRDDVVVQSGRTASDGVRRFALPAADTSVLLSMQKVGFVSATRRVFATAGKTIDVNLLVTPVAAALDSEHIAAHRTADDLVTSIDTNEIARIPRRRLHQHQCAASGISAVRANDRCAAADRHRLGDRDVRGRRDSAAVRSLEREGRRRRAEEKRSLRDRYLDEIAPRAAR